MVTESVLRWPRRGISSVGVLGALDLGESLKGGSCGAFNSEALASAGFDTGEESPESEPAVVPEQD